MLRGTGALGLAALTSSPAPRATAAFLLDDAPKRRTPPVPRAPRQALNRDLAVLLMRSSYNAVDELDFVPMDEFQQKFFLLRQREWEGYRDAAFKQLGRPPEQGELTDAAYFDFISYAQYATINECLASPRSVFEELVGAEGNRTLVYRSSGLRDGDLAPEHSRRVGDAILDFVSERFGDVYLSDDVRFGGVETNVRKMLEWLVVLGFADAVDVAMVAPDKLECKLLAPANLWGLRRLKGTRLMNDFAGKAVQAYLARSGFSGFRGANTLDATSSRHAFSGLKPTALQSSFFLEDYKL